MAAEVPAAPATPATRITMRSAIAARRKGGAWPARMTPPVSAASSRGTEFRAFRTVRRRGTSRFACEGTGGEPRLSFARKDAGSLSP